MLVQHSINQSLDAFKEDFAYYTAEGYTDINAQDRPTADVTFEDHYEFNLGGLDVVLLGVKGAETNDSLIIWMPGLFSMATTRRWWVKN